MARPRYVYVISSPFGYQKIGWSIHPENRLRSLNGANPMTLTVYQTWEHPRAHIVEGLAHDLLDQWRTTGEWFAVKPEVAVAAVDHAIEHLPLETPKRLRHFKIYVNHTPSYNHIWTEDRLGLLTTLWEAGIATSKIAKELNTLTGAKITITHIGVKITELGIERPIWLRGARDGELWTGVRQDRLIEAWPAGVLTDDLVVELNKMPGKFLTAKAVKSRARALRLLRPPEHKLRLAEISSRKQGWRWTPERDAFLFKAYAEGMFPAYIIAGLLALPGSQDLPWDAIRYRAKAFHVKRPDGFFRNLGQAVAEGYRAR